MTQEQFFILLATIWIVPHSNAHWANLFCLLFCFLAFIWKYLT